ncbi:hypothetical protein GCM10010468_28540 [Actinocorallia longicatena]|uniref:Uncharacterized protein n=1 Tax=Actinocorallia longicatena TaxID=111803 RepID=A0ABP6QAT3_9ACTN
MKLRGALEPIGTPAAFTAAGTPAAWTAGAAGSSALTGTVVWEEAHPAVPISSAKAA